jgi:tRNA uridine 5-carbamoylmethylation protein Kti12
MHWFIAPLSADIFKVTAHKKIQHLYLGIGNNKEVSCYNVVSNFMYNLYILCKNLYFTFNLIYIFIMVRTVFRRNLSQVQTWKQWYKQTLNSYFIMKKLLTPVYSLHK